MGNDSKFTFDESEWNTNRTYNRNYAPVPSSPGVYLIVYTDKHLNNEILYVGSSYNLKQRYLRHEVLRILQEVYGNDVRFYFKVEPDYKNVEINLIRQTKARFNKQWR